MKLISILGLNFFLRQSLVLTLLSFLIFTHFIAYPVKIYYFYEILTFSGIYLMSVMFSIIGQYQLKDTNHGIIFVNKERWKVLTPMMIFWFVLIFNVFSNMMYQANTIFRHLFAIMTFFLLLHYFETVIEGSLYPQLIKESRSKSATKVNRFLFLLRFSLIFTIFALILTKNSIEILLIITTVLFGGSLVSSALFNLKTKSSLKITIEVIHAIFLMDFLLVFIDYLISPDSNIFILGLTFLQLIFIYLLSELPYLYQVPQLILQSFIINDK